MEVSGTQGDGKDQKKGAQAASASGNILPFRQVISDKAMFMSPSGDEEDDDLDFSEQVVEEKPPSSQNKSSIQHRKTNDPQQLSGHTQHSLEKPTNLRKHHSELPPTGNNQGDARATVQPSAELPSKIKRSALKPEVIEQLSCLAANVTLRLVGTRWRLVMQQQHLISQHSQQHLPLHPLQQIPNHPSLGFGPSSQTSSTASLSPSTLTPSSPISPYMLSPMNGGTAGAMGHGMFLTIPQQHLHPMTPPQSPFKHMGPSQSLPVSTQPTTSPSQNQTSPSAPASRQHSTASVSPVESVASTTTLNNTSSNTQQQPAQQVQTNSHGSSPLPATYLFHYAHRLRAMVTHTLSRTRAPAQIVPYALLIVHRLVSLRTLPEPLATPTRLLLAALMLADIFLRDSTTPVAAWCAIGRAVGAGVDERKAVAALKIVALEALQWKVTIQPKEFEAWLERLKGWVAGAAAAVVSATAGGSGASVASEYASTTTPIAGGGLVASPLNAAAAHAARRSTAGWGVMTARSSVSSVASGHGGQQQNVVSPGIGMAALGAVSPFVAGTPQQQPQQQQQQQGVFVQRQGSYLQQVMTPNGPAFVAVPIQQLQQQQLQQQQQQQQQGGTSPNGAAAQPNTTGNLMVPPQPIRSVSSPFSVQYATTIGGQPATVVQVHQGYHPYVMQQQQQQGQQQVFLQPNPNVPGGFVQIRHHSAHVIGVTGHPGMVVDKNSLLANGGMIMVPPGMGITVPPTQQQLQQQQPLAGISQAVGKTGFGEGKGEKEDVMMIDEKKEGAVTVAS
ncbi:hypothetical protein HDU97_010391 [Phlyctochytrium planicorne]|nr:hypothetical protein HDU97_010391 [Phlyctochytrium planicorne]